MTANGYTRPSGPGGSNVHYLADFGHPTQQRPLSQENGGYVLKTGRWRTAARPAESDPKGTPVALRLD
jgi:hypothetical protein